MPLTSISRSTRIAALLALLVGMPLAAQQTSPSAMPGFSPTGAAAERTLEEQTIARPDAARAREHSRTLSAEIHVSGTPVQARTRDYVIAQMRAMGLETEVRRYDVFMPHPTAVQLWRVTPRPQALRLAEPAVAGDP